MSSYPPRKAIITVMGHVDHGKTTMLDYIKKSSVASQEPGGITQRIGAFYTKIDTGLPVVFLDTPGHHLFSSMRHHSANITDIIILVVACDDGIMPQTIESINIINKLKVPVIVAANKCDKYISPEKKQKLVMALAEHEIIVEQEGGDVPLVYISALKGTGMDDLLENVATLRDVLDLRGDPSGKARGLIIESTFSSTQGYSATLAIRRGTMKRGDILVCGDTMCVVRQINHADGKVSQLASPSDVVQVYGWRELPSAGEEFISAPSEYTEKHVKKMLLNSKSHRGLQTSTRETPKRSKVPRTNRDLKVPGQYSSPQISVVKSGQDQGKPADLTLLIRANSQGSLVAVKNAIREIKSLDCVVKVVGCKVGPPTKSDFEEAQLLKAHIVLFNVNPLPTFKELQEQYNINVKSFNVIYELADYCKYLIKEAHPTLFRDEIQGEANVLKIFPIYSKQAKKFICGCKVIKGSVPKTSKVRILRKDHIVYEGSIESLKIGENNVDKVSKGGECGIIIENFSEPVEGDRIIAYSVVGYKPDIL